MVNISKLRDDHLRLFIILRQLGAVIERREPPPRLHLSALRHELSAILIAHLEDEDLHLYPRLLGSTVADIAATARTFSDEMGGLADDYRTHGEKWTAKAIAGDWSGYCRECRQILDALTIRIMRENRELYPLLQIFARAA